MSEAPPARQSPAQSLLYRSETHDSLTEYSNQVGHDLYLNPWWGLRTVAPGSASNLYQAMTNLMGVPDLWFNGNFHELLWGPRDLPRLWRPAFNCNLSANGPIYRHYWLPWRAATMSLENDDRPDSGRQVYLPRGCGVQDSGVDTDDVSYYAGYYRSILNEIRQYAIDGVSGAAIRTMTTRMRPRPEQTIIPFSSISPTAYIEPPPGDPGPQGPEGSVGVSTTGQGSHIGTPYINRNGDAFVREYLGMPNRDGGAASREYVDRLRQYNEQAILHSMGIDPAQEIREMVAEQDSMAAAADQIVNDFTRARMREDSWVPPIMPPAALPDAVADADANPAPPVESNDSLGDAGATLTDVLRHYQQSNPLNHRVSLLFDEAHDLTPEIVAAVLNDLLPGGVTKLAAELKPTLSEELRRRPVRKVTKLIPVSSKPLLQS